MSRFLLSYRVTPHTTTGVPPCQLLMRRTLRTLLDQPRPDTSKRVQAAQERQKQHHDHQARERDFAEGEKVFCRDFRLGSDTRWEPAIVSSKEPGSRWFTCALPEGQLVRRHVDNIRARPDPAGAQSAREGQMAEPVASERPSSAPLAMSEASQPDAPGGTQMPAADSPTTAQVEEHPRRSTRTRRAPDRLGFD